MQMLDEARTSLCFKSFYILCYYVHPIALKRLRLECLIGYLRVSLCVVCLLQSMPFTPLLRPTSSSMSAFPPATVWTPSFCSPCFHSSAPPDPACVSF